MVHQLDKYNVVTAIGLEHHTVTVNPGYNGETMVGKENRGRANVLFQEAQHEHSAR